MWGGTFGSNSSERVRSFGIALDIQLNYQEGSHFQKAFAEGSHFWAHGRQDFKRVHAFPEDSQRVRTFGHMLVKTLKGFALLAKTCIGFALLGMRSPKTRQGSHFGRRLAKGSYFWQGCAKGSHFWAWPCQKLGRVKARKGLHFHVFSGLDAEGLQFGPQAQKGSANRN